MSRRARSKVLATSVAALLVLQAGALSGARAASTVEGAPWILALDRSVRRCPLSLKFDAAGAAGGFAMPAGCRRAFPILASAGSWAVGRDGSIELRDAAGQTLVSLERRDDGVWHGVDVSGNSYRLTPPRTMPIAMPSPDPSDTGGQDAVALSATQIITPDPQATLGSGVVELAAASAKPASVAPASAAAGRYAVMRGDRDTGCMVTLEGSGKGKDRARLAPACRDQGINIFDPVAWSLKGSELVLTARKGHSIDLDKDENGVWIKMPKDAKALGLKPL